VDHNISYDLPKLERKGGKLLQIRRNAPFDAAIAKLVASEAAKRGVDASQISVSEIVRQAVIAKAKRI